MAIAWCSPSPQKSKLKSKVEVHGEETEEEEEEDENVQQLEDCARFYKRLEDCLVNTNRNFRACQNDPEIQALRECNDARVKKSTSSSTTAQAKTT